MPRHKPRNDVSIGEYWSGSWFRVVKLTRTSIYQLFKDLVEIFSACSDRLVPWKLLAQQSHLFHGDFREIRKIVEMNLMFFFNQTVIVKETICIANSSSSFTARFLKYWMSNGIFLIFQETHHRSRRCTRWQPLVNNH